jgi:hypothetical protein
MKTRHGFVSNSSSSCFVICKEFLSDKQLSNLEKWHEKMAADEDTYFGDEGDCFEITDYYVSGEVHGIYGEFMNFCDKNGIDKDKIFWHEG